MRKIVCALVVLMFAAPAFARVDITCEQEPDEPNLTISYECTSGEVLRCIGLNIQLDNEETVIAVECLSTDYYVNPGSFTYDGVTPDFGSCVCDSGEPDTLPGIDSNGITIAVCSLYADNDPDHNTPPPSSGGLVKLTLSGEACITITENATRGGILDEDNVHPDVNLPATNECCVTGLECFPNTYTTYNDWKTYGSPLCWCNSSAGGTGDYQCDGDADGGTQTPPFYYRIGTLDLNIIVNNWKKKMSDYPATLDPCADIDHKSQTPPFYYRVGTVDLNILVANWKKKTSDLPGNCPRPE
jgi:hypothetical protein